MNEKRKALDVLQEKLNARLREGDPEVSRVSKLIVVQSDQCHD